jgi:hypothetical protein
MSALTDEIDRIRAALGDDPTENLSPLSAVLVEQALNFRRKNGSVGAPSEVKGLINGLTNGMIDLASNMLTSKPQ